MIVAHIIVTQPLRVIAVGPLDLGDDLVAAAVDGKAVDFRFTQQGGQGTAQRIHGHPHLGCLGAVNVDHHFRLVERQVDVQEGELAGCLGAVLDPLRHVQ
ncbi:hypothetical protein D3C80_1882530 [compost metagenome]